MSVLQSLKHNKWKSKSNNLILTIIWLCIQCENQGQTIEFLWIKSHCGITYNEVVDILAKEATKSGTFIDLKASPSELYRLAMQNAFQEWQEDWNSSQSFRGRHYAYVQPIIPRRPWFHDVRLPRWLITTVCRMRFNHGSFPTHLHRIGISPTPFCDCTNTTEGDINHILFACSKWETHRQSFLQQLYRLQVELPTSATMLLSLRDPALTKELFKFLQAAKISV